MSDTPAPPQPSHRLRIDTAALAANWRALDALSGGASAGAAIKAECYGLGIDACLPALRDAGARQFYVAHWSEVAAALRHVGPDQIAVLHGPMNSADVDYACATGVVPVINSLDQARRWSDGGGGVCHLMIDTGINRLGVAADQLSNSAISALDVNILMSHLASADEDSPMNVRQLTAFRECLTAVPHRLASLANSAGIGLGADYAFDCTRPGLALYGGVPRGDMAGTIQQVAHIEAAIIQTRRLNPGDAVGYNGEFTATKPMRVGTVSLGYADGFLRARGPGALVNCGDHKLPLLGKVSMDMVVADLSDAPTVGEGNWVQVPFNLPDAARQSTVSQYELLTVMGGRLRG